MLAGLVATYLESMKIRKTMVIAHCLACNCNRSMCKGRACACRASIRLRLQLQHYGKLRKERMKRNLSNLEHTFDECVEAATQDDGINKDELALLTALPS